MSENESFRDEVLRLAKENKVVVMGLEGAMVMDLDEMISQPTEGLLYDLNRDGATILTFIDDPKWVNDYAVKMVITRLKQRLDELETPPKRTER